MTSHFNLICVDILEDKASSVCQWYEKSWTISHSSLASEKRQLCHWTEPSESHRRVAYRFVPSSADLWKVRLVCAPIEPPRNSTLKATLSSSSCPLSIKIRHQSFLDNRCIYFAFYRKLCMRKCCSPSGSDQARTIHSYWWGSRPRWRQSSYVSTSPVFSTLLRAHSFAHSHPSCKFQATTIERSDHPLLDIILSTTCVIFECRISLTNGPIVTSRHRTYHHTIKLIQMFDIHCHIILIFRWVCISQSLSSRRADDYWGA